MILSIDLNSWSDEPPWLYAAVEAFAQKRKSLDSNLNPRDRGSISGHGRETKNLKYSLWQVLTTKSQVSGVTGPWEITL